jgi:AraC-like DNA-binding protein
VNVVFMPTEAPAVYGVTTRVGERTLTGQGWALGVMFWPGGFRPFVDYPLSRLTDRVVPLAEVFPGVDLAERVVAASDGAERAAIVDEFLAAAVPARVQPCEETIRLVERVVSGPAVVRVEKLAAESGHSVRQLQRRFADHVGVSPKTVIRRYRLYDAAERVRDGQAVRWSAVATELGYSDQAHLIRDFTRAFGVSPERYARLSAPPP